MPPHVAVTRGVADWVNSRGGSLYVWTEPYGAGFDQAQASVDPPFGLEFERYENVTEFVLWLERGAPFSRPLRLARRWFGLRDGIVADNGDFPSSGGP